MCTQTPVRITAIRNGKAFFRDGNGEEVELSLELAGCARPGEYVTYCRGFALQVFSSQDGEITTDTAGKLMAIILSERRPQPQLQLAFVF